ncbi:MAG: sodium:solute symporter family transporter [candidate division WOR-3 bacterium]|jgi:SSS family transporter
MSPTIIYALVLFFYLASLFVIGVLTSARMKRSAEGFYLGSRSLGPWVTAFSFVAAYFSSVVIIGGGGFGYKYGMATIWIGATNVLIGTLLAWIVLGLRTRALTARLNSITLPDLFAKRYDSPEARFYSALIIGIFLLIYSVSVLQGMGHSFAILMDLPYIYGLLISGIIIIVYVALGGYLAVVWTGFLQAWIMIFSLLLLTAAAVARAGGLAQLFSRLAAIDQGRFVQTPGEWGWAGLLSYAAIVSFGVWGMPQLVSRFYSIKSVKVLKLGTVLATIGATMALLPYFNGAATRLFFPDLANSDQAIPSLVKSSLSPFFGAIFLTGVVAAGMSTFAAVLITAASAIVKDLIRDSFQTSLSAEREVLISRLVAAAIGIIAFLVAIKPPAMILVITGFAWAVIAATTLWPYLFGLYWQRASRPAAFTSMLAGSLTALLWMALKNPLKIHGFIPGIVVSLVWFVLITLIFPEKRTNIQ